jgi:hypothetical protein
LVNYTVIIYKLFLGDPDATTGHPRRGYTVHSGLMRIFPRNTATTLGGGYYTRYNQTGFANLNLDEGDVVEDSFGRRYYILSLKPWTNGDRFEFYEFELEDVTDTWSKPLIPDEPIASSSFFGFENLAEGNPTGMFEDGFERGYFTT